MIDSKVLLYRTFGFSTYCREVQDNGYPDKDHSYHKKPGELDRLHKLIKGMP